MKHRYGEVDQEFATNFFGKCNIFHAMPLPRDIYDYDKYLTPDYIFEEENKTTIKKEEDNSMKNNFEIVL